MADLHGHTADYGVIVHCHLRWDFVWQRPQHLMSRLSNSHPILFLEDAAPLDFGTSSEPYMDVTQVSDTLSVARPRLRPRTGDPEHDAEVDRLNGPDFLRLLDGTIAQLRSRDPQRWDKVVHWFYTPMASDLRDRYDPVAVVYDCMDELANFKFAPPDLKERERTLMEEADLVFTGGPSMYAARRDLFPGKVYAFNSGVDVAHFRRALEPGTAVPSDAARLPHPVLLYYGVIDERMGWDNLAAICDAHPEWSVLMVGPLAKIGEEDLLRRPNLYYTGQRGYDALPGYLKAADVALVPFALSDATRFLSPTKTLEYFAARKPVVSTPILDIVEHYADAARIADGPAAFIAACEAAVADRDATRLDNGERYAQANTWDSIVDRMHHLLDEAVALNADGGAEGTTDSSDAESAVMATGQVRWYSGSRGAGVVDMTEGEEVLAFLPGEAQDDLGGVHEGDPVAVGSAVPSTVAGPAHVGRPATGANLFPLGLDKMVHSQGE